MNRLNDTQKIRFKQLYEMSKIAYPNLLDMMYEDTICYYILNDEDDECFEKLLKNKKSNDILDTKDEVL